MSDNEMKNSVKNHFRIINNFVSDEENDFPNVHYSRSRVKKFLDHKRIKKRAQFPVTLEAKEAAMSNILDPNLNLDGILEPHVRRRRRRKKVLFYFCKDMNLAPFQTQPRRSSVRSLTPFYKSFQSQTQNA